MSFSRSYFALGLAVAFACAVPARAQEFKSCADVIGKARAQRIVDHCWQSTGMTRPPCYVDYDCGAMQEIIADGCQKLGSEAQDFCGEGGDIAQVSDREALQRYSKTVLAAQARVERNRALVKDLRTKIEALVAQRKTALAALKAGQADFAKELRSARAAFDKYNAAIKKPGAIGLDATRTSVKAQFLAVAAHGQALSDDQAALEKLDAQLAQVAEQVRGPGDQVLFAGIDVASAAKAVPAVTAGLVKLAAKEQANALAKTKTASKLQGSAAADAAKLAAATNEAAAAQKRSERASDDSTAAKAISTQLAPVFKLVKAQAQEVAKERKALPILAGDTPAAANARSQLDKTAKKLAQDAKQAQLSADDLERAIQAAAARHRPRAPSAKASGCELEKFDFDNFDYPAALLSQPPERFRRGKSISRDWDGFEDGRPHVASKQFFDLSGNGKKEAIVYIEGPPSAHSGSDNQLRFFEVDDQCRVQQLLLLSGPVSPGELKAKSYFYEETELGTPEGMNGLFPVGNQRVELRYVNGALLEWSRKDLPFN